MSQFDSIFASQGAPALREYFADTVKYRRQNSPGELGSWSAALEAVVSPAEVDGIVGRGKRLGPLVIKIQVSLLARPQIGDQFDYLNRIVRVKALINEEDVAPTEWRLFCDA